MRRLKNKLINIFKPRLGLLSQYNQRSITNIPAYTPKKIDSPLKISIVTPSLNQGHFIEQTITSVLNQNYPNLDYFIQDGGSTDDTLSILEKYKNKLTGFVSQADSGSAQAINLGFAKTSGEIMAYLNSDDLLLPDALHCVADYFQTHPEIDVVYGNRLCINEHNLEIGRWILPRHNNEVLSWADFIPQETLFWRRSMWEKIKTGLDESFDFAMDWDLLIRFRDAGARFAHIPRFLGAFRVHSEQKTSAKINDLGFQEMTRIRERILGRVPDHKEIKRAIFPYLLQHLMVDMLYRIKQRCSR